LIETLSSHEKEKNRLGIGILVNKGRFLLFIQNLFDFPRHLSEKGYFDLMEENKRDTKREVKKVPKRYFSFPGEESKKLGSYMYLQ
jgi:hypothetical protein